MDIRFVTRQVHSSLDYPVAAALIGLPFVLGLGASHPLALRLSVVVGVAALVLTLLTDHETGVWRVIPYQFHVAVDATVGVVFVLAPVILGFAGIDALFYWMNGGAVLAVIALSRPEPAVAAG